MVPYPDQLASDSAIIRLRVRAGEEERERKREGHEPVVRATRFLRQLTPVDGLDTYQDRWPKSYFPSTEYSASRPGRFQLAYIPYVDSVPPPRLHSTVPF